MSMPIETSITALLSECPSFQSKPHFWSQRGTEKHSELSDSDGVIQAVDLIEKKLNKKVSRILDVEGQTPPEHESIITSGLSHRKGKKAYSLTLEHKSGDGPQSIVVTGVPDLVAELGDGRILIVDHKSGGKIHDFRQVSCYALMASIAWGKDSGAVVSYIHHDLKGDDGGPIVRVLELGRSELELIWNDLEELIGKKLSMSLRFTPLCRYCVNHDKCPEVMLSELPHPGDLEFEEKVLWYLNNKGRVSIQKDVVEQTKDEIVSMVDMGMALPDFATMKESKGLDVDVDALQRDYPDQVWTQEKPLGVVAIRKQAKKMDIDLSGYSTEKVTARKIEFSK